MVTKWRSVCFPTRDYVRDAAHSKATSPRAMLREFTDGRGTTWRVWDVYPSARSSAALRADSTDAEGLHVFPSKHHAEGWLCFESASEKRRLTPVPPEWETCDLKVLEQLCGRAGYVSRMTPPGGKDQVKDF